MNKFTMLFLLSAVMVLPFCTTSKKAAGKKMAAPTYAYDADIAPILMSHCSPCHFPPQGQKLPLNSYKAVHDNIDFILSRVQLPHEDPKFMPFKMKKEPLSDSLIMVLKVWKEAGMPEMKTAK